MCRRPTWPTRPGLTCEAVRWRLPTSAALRRSGFPTKNIPITIDLQKRLGIPANPNLFKPEAQLGVVSFKDGKVFYDGQPIGDSAQAAIRRGVPKNHGAATLRAAHARPGHCRPGHYVAMAEGFP